MAHSTRFELAGTIGQPDVRGASSASFALQAGFWMGEDAPPPCPGDANGSLVVDLADLLTVLSNWGDDGSSGGDTNDDGAVNLADLLNVLSNWGAVCE